jgi:hypothetical protein
MTSFASRPKETEKPAAPDRNPEQKAVLLTYLALSAAGVTFALQLLVAVSSDLHLYADGVWHLLVMASTGHLAYWFSDFSSEFFRSRVGTLMVEQAPTLLAIHLGVRSLHALSIVWGLSLYLHEPIAIYLCYRYSRQWIFVLFPLLSLFAGSMNSAALPISDSRFIVSLYWPVLFILLFADELKRGSLILLLALSAPLVLCYESMVAFGLILAGLCLWRLRKGSGRSIVYAGLAAWYLLGVVFAVASLIWPHDPSNKNGFITGIASVFRSGHVGAGVSAVVLLCAAIILFVPASLRRAPTIAFGIGLLAVAYMMLQVLVAWAPWSLDEQMAARTLNLTIPLVASALLVALLLKGSVPSARTVSLAVCLVSALGIAQSVWNMGAALRWTGMLSILRDELAHNQGPIPYNQSAMSQDALGPLHLNRLHATWPLVPLSIYASDKGSVQSLVVPPPGVYRPIDPYSPDRFPDLSAYGITYERYRGALSRQTGYEVGQTLNFAKGGNGLRYLGSGWSSSEDWATWSQSQEFELTIRVADMTARRDILLDASVVPHLAPSQPMLTADVIVNNIFAGQWAFEYKPKFEIRDRQLRIPAEAFWKSNPVRIRFQMKEHLKSPTELGTGKDPRLLGLAFLKVQLSSIK